MVYGLNICPYVLTQYSLLEENQTNEKKEKQITSKSELMNWKDEREKKKNKFAPHTKNNK